VICLGNVQLWSIDLGSTLRYVSRMTDLRGDELASVPGGSAFNIAGQQANAIYQSGRDLIAGDQHNELALKIEPMRRRARNVMRTGFTLLFSGFAVFVVGFALFASTIINGFSHPEAKPNLTGWAIAGAGSAVAALGVLVIVTSLLMKRGVRREEERV